MSDARYTQETITAIQTWVAGKLFSFRTTRNPDFHFKAGQFARLGLLPAGAEEPIWRSFSMVTSPAEDYLEFYAVIVPDGQFSPKLAQLSIGDSILIDKTAFGFLTLDNFPSGAKSLWLLATGTGLSAYLPMLAQAETWQRFDRVVLCHGVRQINELNYQDTLTAYQAQYPERLIYLPLPTREAYADFPQARLTTLLASGELARLAGLELDPSNACVMLCGNPAMLADARKLLQERGFAAGRRGIPGNLAVEKYW